MSSLSFRRLLSSSCMVFGTTVGAGMIGIPAMTAASGFFSAVWMSFLVWVFMAVTGLLLLEVTLKMPQGSNLISMTGRFLGRGGKWVTGFLFVFLYYCLLVAYFSGGAPLLGQLFLWGGMSIPPLAEKLFFLFVFGGVIFHGVHSINRVNVLLTICILLSYVALLGMGSGFVEMSRLRFVNTSVIFSAVPLLFSAFGFHNVIPPLATYLRRDKRTLRLAVLLGTFSALILYLVWQWLILGSIPLAALIKVRSQGLPVTYALQSITGGRSIYVLGQIFAFFALTTSFLGVGFSFVDFIQDGFRELKVNMRREECALLTLIPPFICVLLEPSIFEVALGIAGGFGESLLNGLLPIILFAKMHASLKRKSLNPFTKAILLLLALLSLGAVWSEIRVLLG
jgi:tyrosine-specific transport protein